MDSHLQDGIVRESPLPQYDDNTILSPLLPIPPNTEINATFTPVTSSALENPAHGVITTANCEEPKYARVDLKNKRNSKQMTNGNTSDNDKLLAGTNNA